MKKFILSTFILSSIVFAYDSLTVSGHANSSGAPIGRTGSPGDNNQTCKTCHGGPAAIFQTNQISSNIPETGYQAGETYQITFTNIGLSNHIRFGFLGNVENESNQNVGTWSSNNEVQIRTQGSRSAVTHRSTSNSGTGQRSWTADWTAPSELVGPITFYASFNHTSGGQGSGSGSNIKTSSLTIQPASTVSINDITSIKNEFKLFPNPVNNGRLNLNLDNTVSLDNNSVVEIYSLSGKKVMVQPVKQHNNTLYINNLQSGIYLMNFINNNKVSTQKFIVNN